MPRERVRFTDGVTRVEGAPLSAPYDLRNAELMNNSGVRALESPSEPSSDTPGAVEKKWFRHGSFWRSGRAGEQVGRTLYVSEEDSSGDPVYQEYINTSPQARQNVPQVTSVETKEGNIPVDDAVTEERYIYYLLVPINGDGEAGPYARCGAKVPPPSSSGQLPVLEVQGNDALKEVEVYRTPLFKKTPLEGATGLFYLGRFSKSTSLDESGAVATYYTIPDLDSIDNYLTDLSENRLFLAVNDWEDRNAGDANLVSFNDPVGWRIRFNYLIVGGETTTAPAGGIEPGKVYTITQLGFDDNQPWLRFEDPDTGNLVSFDVDKLFDIEILAAQLATAVQGVSVDYLPPAGSAGSKDTFTIIDDKQWRLDITEVDGEKKTPEAPGTQSFDRPLNVFAPESSDAVASAENYTRSTQSNIRYPEFRELDYNGGIMYGAAPRWPTVPPQPSLVQEGGSQDVKLQFEYEVGGDKIYGPPTYIESPTEIGCQWHGLEDKLNVFVTNGQKFDITNAQVNKDVLRVFDDTDSFSDIAPAGSIIEITGTGTSADGQDIVDSLSYDSTNNEQDIFVDGKIPSGITQGEIQFSDGFTLDTWDTSGDSITISETGSNIQKFVGQPAFVEIEYSTDGTLTNLQTGTFAISSIDIGSSSTTLNLVTLEDGINIAGFVTVFAEYSIVGSQQNDDYFDIDDGSDDAFNTLTSGNTFDVIESNDFQNNKTYTLTEDPTQPSSGITRLTVEHIPVNDTSGKALIGTWALWNKLSPNDDGTYSVDGKGLIWDDESPSEFIYQEDTSGLTNYVSERSKVFFSNINRELEMTFDQFRVPKGNVVRDIFRARLAEEEGLRVYDFYVASGDAIYVAQPSPTDRTVALSAVTTSFGIAENQYEKTIRTILPSGAMVYGTDGRVYKMSGRQVQPVFLDESEPFSTVRDMTYDVEEGVIWMASDTGVWGFDNQRTQIQLQYDYDVTHLVYGDRKEATFAYNDSTGAWLLLDRNGGSRLSASITTQSITEGGQESQVARLKADYSERHDTSYDSGDKSTYIRMRHSIDAPGVASIDNDVDVTTSDIDAVYRLPKREAVYPRLRGYAHQFKIAEFEELDELILDIQGR